jgi:hypothetical protein
VSGRSNRSACGISSIGPVTIGNPAMVTDEEQEPELAWWRRFALRVYGIVFTVTSLGFLACFVVFELSMAEGASAPSVGRMGELTDHGQTVYVPGFEAAIINVWFTCETLAVFAVLAAGFVLQFILRIPVLGRDPFGRGRGDQGS